MVGACAGVLLVIIILVIVVVIFIKRRKKTKSPKSEGEEPYTIASIDYGAVYDYAQTKPDLGHTAHNKMEYAEPYNMKVTDTDLKSDNSNDSPGSESIEKVQYSVLDNKRNLKLDDHLVIKDNELYGT